MKVTLKSVAIVGVVGVLAAALVAGGPASAGRRRGLVAPLSDAAGTTVGKVRMIKTDDGKVLVKAWGRGLAAGFHGFHVHSAGVCDPAATDPSGATVPFFSAGGHYNPDTSKTHGAHAGDMPPLLVASDGTAMLRFKTDRFTIRELMDTDGSAIILHAGPDNLGHIPATTATGGERYHSHVDDIFGADAATKATGDAGARAACGVLQRVNS